MTDIEQVMYEINKFCLGSEEKVSEYISIISITHIISVFHNCKEI